MACTKRTAHKSTGGRVPQHQLVPREPCPEPIEAERLRAELAEVTAARDAAQQHLEQVTHERDQETLAVQRLIVAHRNYERMVFHVLNQRNEAWHEENILRARQVELEQQLAAVEEYNDNLHEEVHLLHNQLHPLLPDDNDDNTDDEGMGSGVFRAEGDDNIEINGPEDVPPEEDEELESVRDKDGGEIFDTNSEDDA
jgi:hypothetical protein